MSILQQARVLKNAALFLSGIAAGVFGLKGGSENNDDIIKGKEYLVRVTDKEKQTWGRENDFETFDVTLDFIEKSPKLDVSYKDFDKLKKDKTYKVSFKDGVQPTIGEKEENYPRIASITEVDKGKTVFEVNDSLRAANTKLTQQNDSLKAVVADAKSKAVGF